MTRPPIDDQPYVSGGRDGAPSLRGLDASRLVPQSRLSGPIPWVIAIMVALVVVATAGGLALRNLADNARGDLSGALTVQIVVANDQARADSTERAASLLRDLPYVEAVRIVPEQELDALLEPWLGAGASDDDIPIPALIDVQMIRSANSAEIAEVQTMLDQTVPGARVDAQSDWLRPVYSALAALQYLVVALIALLSLACAAAVWLASRSSLANHRDTVEILHLLGGTDRQLTQVFQRSVTRDAILGSTIGLILGIAAVWLLGRQFAALDSGMVEGGGLGILDWLLIASIPVAGVALAVVTGRITILSAIRKML